MERTNYTSVFFTGQRDASLQSAQAAVPGLIRLIEPKVVCDVGCGIGTWASAFAEHGCRVFGYDGDYVDRSMLMIEDFRAADLTGPLDRFDPADLAVCLEVGEHLPESAAEQLVATLTSISPAVAFSAAIPEQGGTDHINEQWQSWWGALFAERGYTAVDALDWLWGLEDVAPWYRQNMVLYVDAEFRDQFPHLRDHLHGLPRDVVHPDFYLLTKVSPVGLKRWAGRFRREASWTAHRRARRIRAHLS